jgi:acyl-CoA dehydrogenase family protein 9
LDAARELHGAAAYVGDLAAARRWADARALTLLDGSDLALESYIALEGTRDVRHKLEQLHDPTDVLGRVDAAASLLFGRAKNRLSRPAVSDVPGADLPALHEYAGRLGRAVGDTVRRHGVELVEKQHTQSRLASVVTELAIWSAVAARIKSEVAGAGEVGSRRMIDVTGVWLHDTKFRVESHLTNLEKNNDRLRDAVAIRAYADKAYPFDIF